MNAALRRRRVYWQLIIIIIIIIIILVSTFMRDIYNYISGKTRVSTVYSVATVLHLQFVLHEMLCRSRNTFFIFYYYFYYYLNRLCLILVQFHSYRSVFPLCSAVIFHCSYCFFLISNLWRVLNVVCFLLGNSDAGQLPGRKQATLLLFFLVNILPKPCPSDCVWPFYRSAHTGLFR